MEGSPLISHSKISPHVVIQAALLYTSAIFLIKLVEKLFKWLAYWDDATFEHTNSSAEYFVPIEERYLETLRSIRFDTSTYEAYSDHIEALRDLDESRRGSPVEDEPPMGWQTDSFFDDVRPRVAAHFSQTCHERAPSTISTISERACTASAGCSTISDESVMIIPDTPPRSRKSDASVQCVDDVPAARIMTCPICWVDYWKIKSRPDADQSRVITITTCGHVLCDNCLKTAFPRRTNKLNCPVCSKPYNDANVSQLFF